MRVETVKCRQCGAPLQLDAGVDLARCEYCGFQSRIIDEALERPTSGPTLVETLSLQITDDLGVGLVAAGEILPVVRTQVLATSRDSQDSFTFILRSGNAERPVDNRLIGELVLPLTRPPKHRGTAAGGMTLTIGADGSLSIAVKETGVDNRIEKTGMRVLVVD